jgi:ActR/RegA family two-component response regulator
MRNKFENSMFVDVLQLTHEYNAPAYVVILTNDDNMATAVEILKMEGCRVYVVVPEEDRVGLEH